MTLAAMSVYNSSRILQFVVSMALAKQQPEAAAFQLDCGVAAVYLRTAKLRNIDLEA